MIERITVVGVIPDKSSRSSHGEGFIESSLDKGDFMWRSRSRMHGEWKTRSVCNIPAVPTLIHAGFKVVLAAEALESLHFRQDRVQNELACQGGFR